MARHRQHLFRAGAPGDLRGDIRHGNHQIGIEDRIGITWQAAPMGNGRIPGRSLGREAPVSEPFVSHIIGGHHAHLGAHFDGKIAKRQPPFYRKRAHCRTGIFHRVTCASTSAETANGMQDHILRRDACRCRAFEANAHALWFFLRQGLCGQHMAQFGCANAKGQGAKPAIGAGMAIAAHHGGAGQHNAKLWPHHMHNAIAILAKIKKPDAGFRGPLAQTCDQLTTFREAFRGAPGRCRHRVIRRCEGKCRMRHRITRFPHFTQRPPAREIMQQHAVAMQQRPAGTKIRDHMRVPNLVKQRRRHVHSPNA